MSESLATPLIQPIRKRSKKIKASVGIQDRDRDKINNNGSGRNHLDKINSDEETTVASNTKKLEAYIYNKQKRKG